MNAIFMCILLEIAQIYRDYFAFDCFFVYTFTDSVYNSTKKVAVLALLQVQSKYFYTMVNYKLGALCLFLLFGAACTKGPGVGGRATINGKVWGVNLGSSLSIPRDSGYLANEDVFISYGDATTMSDNQKTGFDGSYSFTYVRPGKYRVWTLSKQLYGISKLDSVVIQEVTVSSNKEQVVVSDLRVYTNKN
jgi:hypothetical protein